MKFFDKLDAAVSRNHSLVCVGLDTDPGRIPAGISVADLIQAGFLAPGTKLVAPYKGKVLEARVEEDGRIQFQKKTYSSLSKAGGAARVTIIGRSTDGKLPATGGWVFWKVEASDGDLVPIGALRDRYLSQGGAAENAG